ncbi:Smr/MutS family protein [Flaviaesturariibacter terrae]
MKFDIGDKIVVKATNEEGEVIDIMNEKMVMIEVRGVKFPAYIDQLDFPYFKRFSEKKLFEPKKEKTYIENVRKEKAPRERIVDGVWLSFLPKFDVDEFGDDVVVSLKIYVINHTEAEYKFTYKQLFFGRSDFELNGVLHAFEDFYLHDIPFSDLSDSPVFSFEFSLKTAQKGKADYYEYTLRLKPKQLFDRIEKLKEEGGATFTYKLFDEYPNKVEEAPVDFGYRAQAGAPIYDASDVRRHLPPARTVVDLHIEKLVDDHSGMSNTAILGIQLKEFEKWYDLALAHRLPKLTVIHGIGKGRLRDDIHDILRRKKEVKSFVNQYSADFGFGATEIFFQHK